MSHRVRTCPKCGVENHHHGSDCVRCHGSLGPVENVKRKLKTYIASSVWLVNVPKEHAASNGSQQFTILVRTTSKNRVAELVGKGATASSLNQMGLHLAPEKIGYFEGDRRGVADIVKKDETIYYFVEHTATGWVGSWFEYGH